MTIAAISLQFVAIAKSFLNLLKYLVAILRFDLPCNWFTHSIKRRAEKLEFGLFCSRQSASTGGKECTVDCGDANVTVMPTETNACNQFVPRRAISEATAVNSTQAKGWKSERGSRVCALHLFSIFKAQHDGMFVALRDMTTSCCIADEQCSSKLQCLVSRQPKDQRHIQHIKRRQIVQAKSSTFAYKQAQNCVQWLYNNLLRTRNLTRAPVSPAHPSKQNETVSFQCLTR